MAQGSQFRVQGSGFTVSGSGFRVWTGGFAHEVEQQVGAHIMSPPETVREADTYAPKKNKKKKKKKVNDRSRLCMKA